MLDSISIHAGNATMIVITPDMGELTVHDSIPVQHCIAQAKRLRVLGIDALVIPGNG